MPRRRLPSPLPALALGVGLAVLAFAPRSARAMEGEWHTGARVGFATLRGGSLGPALDVHGAYELSDLFDVVAQVQGSRHDGSSGTDALSASLGLAYKIDVFQWIPYVSALGGYYHYAGPLKREDDRAGASVHTGLDYLVVRELSVGFDLGFHVPIGDPPRSVQYAALLGAEYRFGW